jgi:hypothetical protein
MNRSAVISAFIFVLTSLACESATLPNPATRSDGGAVVDLSFVDSSPSRRDLLDDSALLDAHYDTVPSADIGHDALPADHGQDSTGQPAVDSAPAPPPVRPIRLLLSATTATEATRSSLTANQGFVTIYQQTRTVQSKDILRLHGQIEITNDYIAPVAANIRLLVNGALVSTTPAQNCISTGAHHMPLWADASYTVPAGTTSAKIELQLAASRSDASPAVKIEQGYGHLLVEHYRRFASESSAFGKGHALRTLTVDKSAAATRYANAPTVPVVVYSLSPQLQKGDIVRLSGQATSQWTAGQGEVQHEMHGQAIRLGNTPIGPWSTENTPWDIQTVPLATSALHNATAAGAASFTVTLHGVLGFGGAITSSGGQLAAMVFSPFTQSSQKQLFGLHQSLSSTLSAARSLVANGGVQPAHTQTLTLEKGDQLRAVGHVLVKYPAGFQLGISCSAQLVLSGPSNTRYYSPASNKYVTRYLELLPLRNALFAAINQSGAHTLALNVHCSRQGASPTLQLVAGASQILADVFRAKP